MTRPEPAGAEAEKVREGAARLGLTVDGATAGRLVAFLQALLDESARVNLTSVRETGAAREVHLLDSLAALLAIDPGPGDRLVDVGTGGGVPGLPIALACPGLRVTLLEAARRKAEACERIVERLGLQERVDVVWARAEDFARGPARESFHFAAVRAVATLPVALELALPLVRPGGRVLVWKGPAAESGEELGRGERALAHLGGGRMWVERYTLPKSGARRMLVVVQKAGATPGTYPRRPGVPRRRPLA